MIAGTKKNVFTQIKNWNLKMTSVIFTIEISMHVSLNNKKGLTGRIFY